MYFITIHVGKSTNRLEVSFKSNVVTLWLARRKSLFKAYIHIWLAMGLRSPYPARIPLSVRPPRSLPAEAGGGCEIFVWIHGLRGLYDLV